MGTRSTLILAGLGACLGLAAIAAWRSCGVSDRPGEGTTLEGPSGKAGQGGAPTPGTDAPRATPGASEQGRAALPRATMTDAGQAHAAERLEVEVVWADTGAPEPTARVGVRASSAAGVGLASELRSGMLDLAASESIAVDTRGIARIEPPLGAWTAWAEAAGGFGYAVHDGLDGQPLRIELVRETPLFARVLDAAGAPALGVEVALRQRRLTALDFMGAMSRAPDGVAEFRHAAVVLREHRTGLEGFSLAIRGLFDPPIERAAPWGNAPDSAAELRLRPSGFASIVLADERGEQVAVPFEVRLAFDGDSRAWSDGRYETGRGRGEVSLRVELGRPLFARVTPEGWDRAIEVRGPGPVREGESAKLRAAIGGDAAVISGRLADEAGAPLGSAHWSADVEEPAGLPAGGDLRFTTGVDGRFDLLLPARGAGTAARALAVRRVGELEAPRALARALLPASELRGRVELGDLVLRDVPVLVAGLVVDARGAPIPLARVEASAIAPPPGEPRLDELPPEPLPGQPEDPRGGSEANPSAPRATTGGRWQAVCDERGRFALHGECALPELRLVARAAGGASAPVAAFVGARDVRIVVEPSGGIAGRLLLDPSLSAASLIAEARAAAGAGGAEPATSASAPVDADGRFEVRGLHQGVWSLRLVFAPGGQELARVDDVRVASGATTRDARLDPLDLRAGPRLIELEIVDEAGLPVRHARAQARPSDDPAARRTPCRRQGERLFALFDGRPLDLVVAARGHLTTALERVDGPRRVVLAPAIVVRVELEDPSVLPAPPHYVGLRLRPQDDGSGGTDTAYFDARGASTLTVESAGLQRLEFTVARPDQIGLPPVPLAPRPSATIVVAERPSTQSFRAALEREEIEQAVRELRRE